MNIANFNPGTPPNWTDMPPYQSQYSVTNHLDYEDCTCYSLVSIMFCLTGRWYSARALATLAQVTPSGAWTNDVLEAANKYGLIPEELWPDTNAVDWDTYYTPIPADVLARADKYVITQVPFDLSVSPGWTQINFPNGAKHLVCQVNATQYFDSEQGSPVKPLNYEGATVAWHASLACTIDHFTTETSDPVTVQTQTIQ